MKLDISKYITAENMKDIESVDIDMTELDNYQGTFPIIGHEPFELTVEVASNKKIYITGETEVRVSIPCDRCLEDVEVSIPVQIDRSFPKEPEEVEVLSDEDEESLELVEDSAFDVDEAVKRELLINWPAKVLCQENCKGICQKCGTNLNTGSCNCEADIDPRMSIFAEVFNKK